jgi:hypothetical protein
MQAKIDTLPDNLNQLSDKLAAIGQDTSIAMPPAVWDPKGPYYSKVELLSNRTSRGGERARAGNPKGWELIVKRGLTTSNGNWVRMHMITAGIGGRDVDGNELPAPTAVNTGGIVRGFETQVERILYGDIPASEVRAARSLFKRLKTRNAVIWVETSSTGFYSEHFEGKCKLYDGATFASSVSFRAGMHYRRDDQWVKDKSNIIAQAQVSLPRPDFTENYQPNFNDIGEPTIAELAEINDHYAREIVAARGGTPAKQPFRTARAFGKRMANYRRDCGVAVTPEFEDALTKVVRAIEKHHYMTWED